MAIDSQKGLQSAGADASYIKRTEWQAFREKQARKKIDSRQASRTADDLSIVDKASSLYIQVPCVKLETLSCKGHRSTKQSSRPLQRRLLPARDRPSQRSHERPAAVPLRHTHGQDKKQDRNKIDS